MWWVLDILNIRDCSLQTLKKSLASSTNLFYCKHRSRMRSAVGITGKETIEEGGASCDSAQFLLLVASRRRCWSPRASSSRNSVIQGPIEWPWRNTGHQWKVSVRFFLVINFWERISLSLGYPWTTRLNQSLFSFQVTEAVILRLFFILAWKNEFRTYGPAIPLMPMSWDFTLCPAL